jgi:hypothetical protein
MAKRNNHDNDQTYVQTVLSGDLGPRAQAEAETAVTTAVEHGYDDDPARVADTLRALLSDDT